jgi:hypothetical protein
LLFAARLLEATVRDAIFAIPVLDLESGKPGWGEVGTDHALAHPMKDLIFVAVTVGFFAITWFYVKAAARL